MELHTVYVTSGWCCTNGALGRQRFRKLSACQPTEQNNITQEKVHATEEMLQVNKLEYSEHTVLACTAVYVC